MKNSFQSRIRTLLFFALTLTIFAASAASPVYPAGNGAPPKLNLSVTLPEAWKSLIVRQDFENQSIFSLKTGNSKTAFLFSVTKVSNEQWLTLKDQIKDYSIIENKDDFITFVQKTTETSIKGASASQYQQVLQGVDGLITSIHLD